MSDTLDFLALHPCLRSAGWCPLKEHLHITEGGLTFVLEAVLCALGGCLKPEILVVLVGDVLQLNKVMWLLAIHNAIIRPWAVVLCRECPLFSVHTAAGVPWPLFGGLTNTSSGSWTDQA